MKRRTTGDWVYDRNSINSRSLCAAGASGKEKEDRDNEIALLKKQLELLQKSAAQGTLPETANGENTATSAKDENMQSENGQNGSVDENGN